MRTAPLFVDYVVVGAGSSGCVVASRLSEDPACSVLVIEAGGWDDHPEIHDVSLASAFALWDAAGPPDIDWGYETLPQEYLGNRTIPIARGKVVGGCGSINALVWVRGNSRDYDHWAQTGAAGWSYADVLPYFRHCEEFLGRSTAWRGGDGPVSVWKHANLTPAAEAFIRAADEIGYSTDDRDYNGEHQDGFGFGYQTNRTKIGTRCSTATGYLHPIRRRSNLTVLTRSQVTHIGFTGGAVKTVEYLTDGQRRTVHVDQGAILSAGAFETPKLLMLSGIGPAAELKEHGIDCLHHTPEVGQNLQDHIFVGVTYDSKIAYPDAELVSEAGLFTRTTLQNTDSPPDLQMTFGTGKFLPPNASSDQLAGPGFTFGPVAIQPHSRGEVLLASADPLANARVQPRYLSDPADTAVLIEGIELARDIVHASAFDELRGAELAPGPSMTDKSELATFISAAASTLWHPVGTCRMGSDDGSVVDPTLRVHGVENLWIADASIMPSITSGNTHAPCVMIGERAAEFIKKARRLND
ncbi:choline dehydrogenase [Mycobacteroides chelonae]|uniref:Choline dehydrogenase n=1 Tax=Mycobacteroides chelonae TaxID=1774 RepID=A0A1S1LZ04_MYCCH|nr:GMC family oxidoreductase N-terminal domain-containing protein [Mycobacteroides chelonae]OHU28264.1 choline dehydrogenase [Mycobacteroides chelonae]OHU63689.1 choline dehydrogenase [Mycobacteroides chelonae]OHU76422.1 choline dehydrogenase [Mycobacteroides chelonae]QQG88321.1 choline dehydrogenase [Mycobacteroides chelonae]QQG93138.1 choline dehydrogenase [Mycobacteroides chelonae]